MLACTYANEGSTFSWSREQQLCHLAPGLPAATESQESRNPGTNSVHRVSMALAPVSTMCQQQPSARHFGQRKLQRWSGSPCTPLPVGRDVQSTGPQIARSGARCSITQGGRSQLRPVPWGR